MIETRNEKGELHSFDDNPAIEMAYGYKEWYKDGKLHRDNGPASIDKLFDFSVTYSYYKEGRLHRFLGPAYLIVIEGIKTYEAYYIKGKLHNPIGPAKVWYPPFYTFDRVFFIHGNWISFDDFIKQLEGRLNI